MRSTPPPPVDLASVFVAVAESSSFSKAARQLGVTKGTVSRGIARLEQALGVKLIHRTTHHVALSTAGIALYERAAPHLRGLVEAFGDLPEAERQEPSGELRITAPYDLGVTLLPPVVSGFRLRYPKVQVDLRLTNRKVEVVAEGFDLAIRFLKGRPADSSLSMRNLGTCEMRMYAAPGYVVRRGEPRQMWEAHHDWVAFGPAVGDLRLPKGSRPCVVADDLLLVRELLRAGTGVGILPWFLGEPCVCAGELVEVSPKLRWRDGGFVLAYPSSRQIPRKVTAFRDFLLEALRTRPMAPRA